MKKIWMVLLLAACSGSDGATGPMGPSGRDGIDGKDAVVSYDSVVALSRPFIGEEIAKIPVIQGPKGDTGDKGDPGQGIQGPKGDKGDPGLGIQGDSIVIRKIRANVACFGDYDCLENAQEAVQIRANAAAGLGFQANMNGLWGQNPKSGYSSIAMSPDLGLRLCQNQRWDKYGTYYGFIVPEYPVACVGFDSQAAWSWNWLKPGQPNHGTQQVVLDEDDLGNILFKVWRTDRRIGFATSSCKFCANEVWIAPTKP
jgi:hypothetical protein